MNKGNKHALKLPELKHTEPLVIPCTLGQIDWMNKQMKKGKRAEWCRQKLFPIGLLGAFYGAALCMQY